MKIGWCTMGAIALKTQIKFTLAVELKLGEVKRIFLCKPKETAQLNVL